MGRVMQETNQNTHGQEAYWTKIAPMISPRAGGMSGE